jgi:hypothetical protein
LTYGVFLVRDLALNKSISTTQDFGQPPASNACIQSEARSAFKLSRKTLLEKACYRAVSCKALLGFALRLRLASFR